VHHEPVVTSTPQTTPQKRIKASASMQAVVEAAPQDYQQSIHESYRETSTRSPAAPSAVNTPTSTQSGVVGAHHSLVQVLLDRMPPYLGALEEENLL
jgi:hypothetical protein